jgi:hypothetical protein
MYTEHLQNVRPVWVLTGWLIAAAVTSLAGLALASAGLLVAETTGGITWPALAVAVGFFTGGLFLGFRTMEAPILHGVAMGLTSLVVWVLLNMLVGVMFETVRIAALWAPLAAGLLFVQILAGIAGAATGRSMALRGTETKGE